MDKIHEYKVFKDWGKRSPPQGYKRITVHMVFDVKYNDRKRARLVGGGHQTEATNDTPFSGIATLKYIRVCLLLAIYNNLDICAADVSSAYLEAYTQEKLYIIAGPEFKELEGHILLIDKALYGLRSSGARWAEKLADTLLRDGWKQTKFDPAI